MKKVNLLMLSLITMIACLSLSSCDTNDEPEFDYYFKLVNVGTNLVDANGQSLASSFMDEWKSANNANYDGEVSIGTMSEQDARKWFNKTINSLVGQYDKLYKDKGLLPEKGFIRYYFQLYVSSGTVEMATIEVSNDGAKLTND